MAVYAMFGVLMLTSKIGMEAVPNVHLLGMFTMLRTVVYRRRALYPIYVYVLLNGVYAGFASWWLPYLYIWTVLWGVTMLLPRNMPKKCAAVVYPLVCALHGLAFGTLYAPAQALIYGLSLEGMLAWIVAGPGKSGRRGADTAAFGAAAAPEREVRHSRRRGGQMNTAGAAFAVPAYFLHGS